MSKAIENLHQAQARAMQGRPKVGGFPYLAETLRKAGVIRNVWILPACQSTYFTEYGLVVSQATPVISETADVPPFDSESLVRALRADQAGASTFPEFMSAAWRAGVVRYDVDLLARTVAYFGGNPEDSYIERYPEVNVD